MQHVQSKMITQWNSNRKLSNVSQASVS